MTRIADSGAIRDRERILSQHLAALTLLQARLSIPGTPTLRWLDLACGRGQIISSLNDNLSPEARANIHYCGYDIDQKYTRETMRTAEQLGFASLETGVGDLSNFHKILPEGVVFDFITLTNTVHEIEPVRLPEILTAAIERLADTGTFFIYDLERIKPPELGALPWNRDDIRIIVYRMLDALGASVYRPEVGRWNHRSCNGWNIQLQRQHLNVSRTDAESRSERAILETREEVLNLLKRRLIECRRSLEALTLYGAETAEEQEDKEQLLFELWALSRALEHYL